MATLYSIFFASIRKVTQEKLSLGLLLFDDENVYFKFSSRKLAGLKAFLPKEDFQLIHHSINAVNKKILVVGERLFFQSQELFRIRDSAFSLDYINYLSRYKNNLITYSEPKPIDLKASTENVLKLFDNLIGPEIFQQHRLIKASPIEQLNIKFEGRIEQHFNLNYTLTSEQVPNLLVPVKVDLLGRNGMDVLVRTIDTSNGPEKMTNEVSTFYVLKDAYKKNNTPVKDFIMAEEPLQKFKKQHDIWRQIRDSGDFDYLDLSEAEKLKEYAEMHHVKPAVSILDKESENLPF